MTQNNLYMENDEMKLYVDVQPLLLDEIETSRNAAVASAASAAQSETNARNLKNSIADYKTSMELFYAQASDGLSNIYNNSISEISLAKYNVLYNIESAKNSAIDSVSSNGQHYVEQVQNIVDNRVSIEHLSSSKCLSTGEEITDADAVSEIKNYARSTFDRTKFIEHGSVKITPDGIASGFSTSNYLYKNITVANEDILDIDVTFTYNSFEDVQRVLMFETSELRVLNMQGGTVAVYIGASTPLIYRTKTVLGNPADGSEIRIVLKLTATESAVSVYVNGVLNYTETKTGTYNIASSLLYIGKGYAEYFKGSIDLKGIRVNINTIPVFNCNKTGMDVLKLDDFTTVGTPSITFDGISRGFSSSNYLTKSITVTNNDVLKFDITFTYNTLNQYQRVIMFGTSELRVLNMQEGVVAVVVGGGTPLIYRTKSQLGNPAEGSLIRIVLELSAELSIASVYVDGVLNYTETKTGIYNIASSLLYIGKGYAEYFSGSIDLNLLKVYLNGNLVYQPCLKIPYTESKTGSKIVNSIYNERVKDAAEQKYIQRYYTLDEEQGKARLPIGDIYGMIEALRKLIMERTAE